MEKVWYDFDQMGCPLCGYSLVFPQETGGGTTFRLVCGGADRHRWLAYRRSYGDRIGWHVARMRLLTAEADPPAVRRGRRRAPAGPA